MDDRAVTPVDRIRHVALAAVLVLATACAKGTPAPVTGASQLPGGSTSAPDASGPATASRPGGSSAPSTLGGGSAPTGDRTAAPVPVRVGDAGDPGANAAAYLRPVVPELVVEIDAVAGKTPHAGTVDLLRQRLAAVVDKPGGMRFLPMGSLPAHGGAWSVDDLRAAERAHRTTHNTPETASLYLMYVDGSPPKEGAIGIAYSASSAAIFSDQIEEASTLLVSAAAIEAADTVHEVGHLLSLVNLGYTSSRPHEDPAHPGHSDNPGSVMYWAVDNVGVVTLLGGRTEPPTDFDADDLADLAAIRSGKAP